MSAASPLPRAKRRGVGPASSAEAAARSASRSAYKTRVFTAIVVLSNAFGNYAMARGMRGRVTASALDYILTIFTPWVMLGVSLLIVWLLSRMALMSWADLSYVLPVTSVGYVVNALVGRFLLDEHVTPGRWAGTVLVVAGAMLVGRGSPQSKGAL